MLNEGRHLEADDMSAIELTDEDLERVSGGKKSIYVKVKEANIRSGPGTEYSIVWGMGKGDELIYLGEKKKNKKGELWVKVKAVCVTGWIRSDLVRNCR